MLEAAKKTMESMRTKAKETDPILEMENIVASGDSSAKKAENLALALDSEASEGGTRGSGLLKVEKERGAPLDLKGYKKILSDQPEKAVHTALEMIESNDPNIRREGVKILQEAASKEPTPEGKLPILKEMAGSKSPDVHRVARRSLENIAVSEGATAEVRISIVGIMYDFGGEEAKIKMLTELATSKNVPPLQQIDYAIRLVESDPAKARKISAGILGNPNIPAGEKLSIAQKMMLSSNKEMSRDGLDYLYLMALLPKAPIVEVRMGAVDMIKNQEGPEVAIALLQEIAMKTNLPPEDRNWAIRRSIKEGAEPALRTLETKLIENFENKPPKEQGFILAIAEEVILKNDPTWVKEAMKGFANSTRGLIQIQALALLAMSSETPQSRDGYRGRLSVYTRQGAQVPFSHALEAAKAIAKLDGNTQILKRMRNYPGINQAEIKAINGIITSLDKGKDIEPLAVS